MMKHLFIGFPVTKTDSEEHRNLAINAIVFASSILVSGFILLNFFKGHYVLLGVESVSLLLFLLCTIPVFRDKHLLRRNMIIAASSILLVGLLVDGGVAQVAIFWSLLIPFLACLFMGLPNAWYWIGAYAAVMTLIFGLHLFWKPFLPYDNSLLTYFPFVYIQFSILAAILQSQYEWSELKHQKVIKELDDASKHLEEKVFERTKALEKTNEHLKNEINKHGKTAEALKDSEIQLYQMQKVETIDTLVGGIAHDFNNMLAGINANMFMIKQKIVDEPDVLRRAKDVEKLVMNASNIVKQLLTFARKDHVDFEKFDLPSFLNEAYKLSEVAVSEHIAMRFDNYKGRISVLGNKTQIQQVLMNIINNARDAVTRIAKPAILVSLKKYRVEIDMDIHGVTLPPGEYALLSVRDNGEGIAKDKLDKIFEPFFTTKEVGKGTGLGLSMCFGAIQSHGGGIGVRSKVGLGSIFEVFIPITASMATESVLNEVVHDRSESGETILLVDDDEVLRKSQKDALESIDYHVLTAENGKEAVEIFRKTRESINLIVIDLTMPIMGGVKAVRHMRELDQTIKVIFVTGHDRDSTFNGEGLPNLNETVLEKPYTMLQLHDAIQKKLRT